MSGLGKTCISAAVGRFSVPNDLVNSFLLEILCFFIPVLNCEKYILNNSSSELILSSQMIIF